MEIRSRVRGVVFDLDGTLLDTLDDISLGMNSVLAARGLPLHPRDAYKMFAGNGTRALVARAMPPDSPEPAVDEAWRAYVAAYDAREDRGTRPYPGVPELIDSLVRLGVPFAVNSNKPQASTERVLAKYFPGAPFKAIIAQVPHRPNKPDPAGALMAAGALGLPASAIAFVGDSSVDMETAVNAGMAPVGVLWGFREKAELLARGAAALAGTPSDVLELFREFH